MIPKQRLNCISRKYSSMIGVYSAIVISLCSSVTVHVCWQAWQVIDVGKVFPVTGEPAVSASSLVHYP
jgi:hypothetical protein